MKLLTKTTLYFLTAMILLLLIAGFYLFNQFNKELNDKSDKELLQDEAAWIQYLETQVSDGVTFILKTQDIAIYPVDAAVTAYPLITDAKSNNSKLPYRQLSQVVAVYGIPYLISIKKSQEQKAALITNTTRIILFVFAGLFIAALLFNWIISKNLWQPFNRSLYKIRHADLRHMENIHFENTNTKEFNELNSALNNMTQKIYKDFVNMKEFTENAAHEMQTPLAVAQSKMELLLQSNLSNEQAQLVMQSATSLNRLTKLNQGLLLLAKIENNQYETNEEISLTEVNKKYLRLFAELISDKQLAVSTNFENDFIVKLHPLLADSLVSNLLGNAVKYNYNGGNIDIAIAGNAYRISNTSLLEPIKSDQLFKRFRTSSNNEETSNGLGLAIIKKIADTHNLAVNYTSANNVTVFEIRKKP